VWGVSRNTRRRVDLTPGLVIGFDPQDDAEAHAAAIERLDSAGAPLLLGGIRDVAHGGEVRGVHRHAARESRRGLGAGGGEVAQRHRLRGVCGPPGGSAA
jgi:hypothetical protein